MQAIAIATGYSFGEDGELKEGDSNQLYKYERRKSQSLHLD